MQRIASYIFKAVRRLLILFWLFISRITTWVILIGNNVKFKNFYTSGIPFVSVAMKGNCTIKRNFRMNNGNIGNPIGRPQRCILFVDNGASLEIGENVGMSSAALIANEKIVIGDNVKIGGGVCIYDSDFHSLNPEIRRDPAKDLKAKRNKPVVIKENAFIGAHSIILKGVTIGENSIIGASSVISRNVPPNEIWAGNPAVFIKKLEYNVSNKRT